MKVFKIIDNKTFTSGLFLSEIFDNFLVTEATFVTDYTTSVIGKLSDVEADSDEYVSWGRIRGNATDIIKSTGTPRSFKIVFRLNKSNTQSTLASIGKAEQNAGFYLNIKYNQEGTVITTGTSADSFIPDRSLDTSWDSLTERFLHSHGFETESL